MNSFLGKISEKYICLSSQIDLYRNLKGFNFLYSLSFDEEIEVYNKICSEFYKLYYSDKFNFERLNSKQDVIRYFEKGILHNDGTVYRENSHIASRDDGFAFLKINCKEHLCITGKLPGVNFFRCGHFAYGIEADLDEKLEFAFNTKYGFVFQDVSLTGTGLRMLGLLHIPSLRYYKSVDILVNRMNSYGIKFYSLEKIGICEDFYVIEFNPNNSEEFSAIRKMDKYVSEIVALEMDNRRKLLGIKSDYY